MPGVHNGINGSHLSQPSEILKIKHTAPKPTAMGAVTFKPSDRAKFKKSRQEKTPTLPQRKVERNWKRITSGCRKAMKSTGKHHKTPQ